MITSINQLGNIPVKKFENLEKKIGFYHSMTILYYFLNN